MSRRENVNNESNGNNSNHSNNSSHSNTASGIYHDSAMRGYSRRHSYYDDAFNMDF